MLKTIRDMLAGAIITFGAMFTAAGYAALTLPAFNGPFLGDNNTNLYTVAQAINQFNQQQAQTGLTATGTTQATALQLGYGLNQLGTVASSTGVALPPCNAGAVVYVTNDGANSVTVYGQLNRTDTINATAGATGVAQANGAHAIYVCASPDATTAAAGKWTSIRATS